MHLPSSSSSTAALRDRSFYAKFYSRPPSEIEIIDKVPGPSCVLRTLSESPTTLTPLSDASSSATSGFFSSSDCSSSESTSSYTKRRRTTAPTIQARLNTYESACIRPSVPQPALIAGKPKTQCVSPPSLVNQILPQQQRSAEPDERSLSTAKPKLKEKSISLDLSKRYLSKSTSQLCDDPSIGASEEQLSLASSSRNILDVIQEELSEIRRTDHDLKDMFLSIYGKIQNIQQLKSAGIPQQKGQRHHYERPSRSITHSCYSSNSDIRRSSCPHHHHTRKYALHSIAALRHRMNNTRASSTADNDSYVDTDSSSSLSDSGTCSSPMDNEPCGDD